MNNFIADFFKWALELVYSFVGSYGWAIIIVTVLMRLVVLPLDIKQRKGMRIQQRLQPQLQEIQKKYANDQAAQQRKTQELYKAAGYHPLAGCLPMIIQMVVLFAFFGAQRSIALDQIKSMFETVYSNGFNYILPTDTFESFLWVKNLWQADTFNIGISQINSSLIPTWQQVMAYSKLDGFNLAQSTYNLNMAASINYYAEQGISNGLFILPVLATVMSFLQSKFTMAQTPQQQPQKQGANDSPMPQMNSKMFQYMMPVMSLVICTTTSAAYALYWTTTTVIAVISFAIMNKAFKKEDEAAELEAEQKSQSRKMERKLPKI